MLQIKVTDETLHWPQQFWPIDRTLMMGKDFLKQVWVYLFLGSAQPFEFIGSG